MGVTNGSLQNGVGEMSDEQRTEIANRIIVEMIHSDDFNNMTALELSRLAMLIASELEK